jgi:hypothetical protein
LIFTAGLHFTAVRRCRGDRSGMLVQPEPIRTPGPALLQRMTLGRSPATWDVPGLKADAPTQLQAPPWVAISHRSLTD